jgi:hypothetical protein
MDRALRWFQKSVSEQLANVGSEVSRAIRWENKGDHVKKMNFYRKAIDFLELSEQDPKNQKRLKELSLLKEELEDYFEGENLYMTTDKVLLRYYDSFLQRLGA